VWSGGAGWLESFHVTSEAVTNLAAIDLQYVTIDHLYAALTAVSQWLSDNWSENYKRI